MRERHEEEKIITEGSQRTERSTRYKAEYEILYTYTALVFARVYEQKLKGNLTFEEERLWDKD